MIADPLSDFLSQHKIRIAGTSTFPLFALPDVANHIRDTKYKKKTIHFSANYLVTRHNIPYLTELGLHRYLLQTKKQLAEPFHCYLFQQLHALRLREIQAADQTRKYIEKQEIQTRHLLDLLRLSLYNEYLQDSTPQGMADYHIAVQTADRNIDLPDAAIKYLRKAAISHFRKDQVEYAAMVRQKVNKYSRSST